MASRLFGPGRRADHDLQHRRHHGAGGVADLGRRGRSTIEENGIRTDRSVGAMRRAVTALGFLFAFSASAQVTETLDVAITSIDVVVTDGKGNRVRGLTRADFEVYENGQLREITNFTEYAAAPPAAQAATAPAPEAGAAPAPVAITPPRRMMIVFDANTLTATHRRNATAAAASFIEQHMRPNDKVMVAVLSQQFVPRLDWTNDRAALQRVFKTIGSETALNTVQADLKRAEEEIEGLIELAASTSGDDNSAIPPSFDELMDVGRTFAERSLQNTRAAASLLGTIVTQFGKQPDKKALIFIGEGLDARPGWELFQMLEGLKSGARHSPGMEIILKNSGRTDSPVTEASRYNASSAFAALANIAYRSGVPIYAINPGTNEDIAAAIEKMAEPPDRVQDFSKFASKFLGYDLVATYSGGAAFVGQRADLALSQVAADLGGYYSIGFRAAGPPKDAGAIRVRTKRGRVRASLATAAPVELADAITEAVTAHHLVDPSSNELEIALDTSQVVAEGAKQKVTLSVIIPIRNLKLERSGADVTGGFDVYLSISDGKGYFSPVSKQTHAIKWPADQVPEDDERTMTYTINVTMEPGASQISVGVIDHLSKRTGFEKIGV